MANKLSLNQIDKKIQIFLIGFLILFLELSLIRIFGSEIIILSFFSNLVVIASFFGIGIGCLLNTKKDLFKIFPLLFFIIPIISNSPVAVESSSPDSLMFNSIINIIEINSFYIIPVIFILTACFFCWSWAKIRSTNKQF